MTISGSYSHSVAVGFGAQPTRSNEPTPVPPVMEVEPGPPPDPRPAPVGIPDLPRTTLPGQVEAPPASASDRAARLIAALDRDGDNLVTKAEFTEGLRELLKRAGTRPPREEGEDDERAVKRAQRLERRLERLFDRVDTNEDGSITAAELAEAFRRMPRLGRLVPGADAPSEGDPTRVTATVNAAVAVQQYARAGREEPRRGALTSAA